MGRSLVFDWRSVSTFYSILRRPLRTCVCGMVGTSYLEYILLHHSRPIVQLNFEYTLLLS